MLLKPGGVENGKNLFEVSKTNEKYWGWGNLKKNNFPTVQNNTEDLLNSFLKEVPII